MSHDEEYVEIVDENNELTGRVVTISEAHDKILPHRVAVVLVFSNDGRLYVQVRNEPGFRRDHTAAGHVDVGEDVRVAAMREMMEEIGLDAPLELVASGVSENQERSPSRGKAHVFEIYKTIADDWGFVPNEEVSELLLMSVDEILADMKARPELYTHGFVRTLEAYISSMDGATIDT